jgi:short-subunit dehydrogenase
MARTALVTGASGGLGAEFAELLARDGYDLALTARSAERLERYARDLEGRYAVKVAVFPLDLAEPGAPRRLLDATNAAGITVDVLINNAGYGSNGAFAELPFDEESGQVRLNVLALTELTKLYLPAMLARRSGKVLNVASTAAFQPGPFMAVYCATKAYVLSFSEALAEELRDSGVTVTCFCPGPTATGFQERANVSRSYGGNRGLQVSARGAAQRGYAAMRAGKAVEVDGLGNRAMAIAPRLAPRVIVRRIAAVMLRPR